MENLLVFWGTPKEVAMGWYIYLSIMIVMSIPLVINSYLSQNKRKILIQLLLLGTLTGFFILVLTNVGLDWPDIVSANEGEITAELLEGEKIFLKYGCLNCHQVGDFGTKAGPDLAGVSSRKDRETMWIFFDDYIPGRLHSVMPNYKQIMKPEELELLLNFLENI